MWDELLLELRNGHVRVIWVQSLLGAVEPKHISLTAANEEE
jgi:hypothetical protein